LQHVEKPRSSRELPHFLLSPKIKIFGDPVIKDKEHGKKLPACLRGIEWEK
jgi:hypothetical protein